MEMNNYLFQIINKTQLKGKKPNKHHHGRQNRKTGHWKQQQTFTSQRYRQLRQRETRTMYTRGRRTQVRTMKGRTDEIMKSHEAEQTNRHKTQETEGPETWLVEKSPLKNSQWQRSLEKKAFWKRMSVFETKHQQLGLVTAWQVSSLLKILACFLKIMEKRLSLSRGGDVLRR